MTHLEEPATQEEHREPSLLEALLPIAVLICILTINVLILGSEAINGPNQVGLLLSAAFAGVVSIRLGYSWHHIEQSMLKSIHSAMGAMLILLIIGALSGAWMISGIVPAMIYYGLKALNPTIFLLAACISASMVSMATGSSWTTVATIGVALLGVGKALGFHEGVVAGAIISGAYFGDKMSPLSDTTNLAPAMAGTDLITHIKYMTYTTLPTLLITLVIFGAWGFVQQNEFSTDNVDLILQTLEHSFYIGPALFIVPAIVIYLIVKRMPALPALLIGALLGVAAAIIFQPQVIDQVSGINSSYAQSAFVTMMKALASSVSIETNHVDINELLTSKGMFGMLNTIWLILCAMIFGGVMESGGLLNRIAKEVVRLAHSTGSLVASTVATCIFFNVTASDQYMAIAIPGRMYSGVYRARGLRPELLSRTLEDAGTVTSVLVPWNTCGATQAGVLQVSTWVYAPFAFFCLISPVMSILQAYLNFKIRRLNDDV